MAKAPQNGGDQTPPTSALYPQGTETGNTYAEAVRINPYDPANAMDAAVPVNLSPFVEVGSTGLKRMRGYVLEEFLVALKGRRGMQTLKEMEQNDPIIGAMLFAIDMFMRKVKWYVEPSDDSPVAIEQAEFVRQCMFDMSHTWQDFISEVMTMLTYGWAYFETVYKRRNGYIEDDPANPDQPATSRYDDGRIGWRKISLRSQVTLKEWVFDKHGGIQAMVQWAPPTYQIVPIPIQKSLLFRTTTRNNNPEGRSVLRNAYRPWYFKKRIEEVEGVGIERDLAGLPVAKVPAEMLAPNASTAMQASLAAITKLVRNIRRDEQEGVIWPMAYDEAGRPLYELELMASSGSRQFDISGVIDRKNREILNVVLADFIVLGQEAVGSYALSVDKTGMFKAALEAWADGIAAVLNNYAIPRLLSLNGMDLTHMPTIEHENVQSPSLADLAALITALAGAGAEIFPDDKMLNHILDMADLPQRESADTSKESPFAMHNSSETAQTGIDVDLPSVAPSAPPMSQEAPAPGSAPPPTQLSDLQQRNAASVNDFGQ